MITSTDVTKIKTILLNSKIDPVNVMALRHMHRYAGHIARQITQEKHVVLRAAVQDGELAWQNSMSMLNNGNIGHPKRFYAGQQWERNLHTYYWKKYEKQWRVVAQDRRNWRRTEEAWIQWSLLPRWETQSRREERRS